MSRTRFNSKHLSRPVGAPDPRAASYKNTMVWRWLNFVIAGGDDVGRVIKLMRRRMDMPNQFPNRSYLRQTYLINRCRLEPALAERVHVQLWNLYAQYRDAEQHNTGFDPIRPGVTRNPWKEDGNKDQQYET